MSEHRTQEQQEQLAQLAHRAVLPILEEMGADGYIFSAINLDNGHQFTQCGGTELFKMIVPSFAQSVANDIRERREDPNKELREQILEEIDRAA